MLDGRKGERGDVVLLAYAWIVGLKNSHFNAFVFEVSLALGKVQRRMVRRSVPTFYQPISCSIAHLVSLSHQFVKKVILSVDILT